MDKIIKKDIILQDGIYFEEDINRLIEKGIRFANIVVICPKCNKKKIAQIPVYQIKKANSLAQFFVKKDFVCKHNFMIFVDKNCVIRSSTLVNFVLE
jgi:hypothetical protein